MGDVCPWCSNPLELTARKPGGKSTSTRTGREWYGQSYRHEVEALGPRSPDLAPGQVARFETPLRPQSVVADVVVPVLQAAAIGTAATLVFIVPTVFVEWLPWHTPFLVWPTVTGGALFVTSKAARKLLMRVEEWTGQDIDGDGQVGNAPITIPHKERRGSTTHWRYPQIPTPRTGREWLARWFWRICRKHGTGFSQNVAQNYHIARDEVRAIQDVFVTEGWATRNKDNSVALNTDGLDVMADVVAEIFPTAALSPDAA